jgi:HEAT repeat protein
METSGSNPVPASPEEDLVEVRKPTSLLIAQFFLFPLIIIAICVGIFLFFGYISYEMRTPDQYLTGIRSGSETQRWQHAFELSNLVTSNPDAVRSPEFISGLVNTYKDSPDSDIRVRGFIALMLGRLQDRTVLPALIGGLSREERLKAAKWEEGLGRPSLTDIQEYLVQSQIYTLWALGSIGDNAAVPSVLEYVDNPDPSIRVMAVYVLGVLKDPSAIPSLRVRLNDAKEDVQWNAALSLAQLQNSEGADLLMKLIEPGYIDTMAGITPEARSELRVNAVKALAMIQWEPARGAIDAFSRKDPDLAVRNASLEALKKF